MTNYRLSLLFLLIVSLFTACEKEEDDPCKECQSAIDHMYDKIDQNGCNPDYMENAHSRLREDCGIYQGNIYAGYMSHTCFYVGQKYRPVCRVDDSNEIDPTLTVSHTPIDIRTSTQNPDTLEVMFLVGSSIDNTYLMGAGQNAYEVMESSYTLFTVIDVVVLDPETEEVLVQGSDLLNVYRPGAWTTERSIVIRWSPVIGEYVIDFNDF